MSKQDRQGARTVTDLERKYNFGASFAEVYKLIDDVQVDSEKALEELDKKLTPEEIFNRLTGYKTYQGVFRGADGNLYVNAEIIKGGTIESGVLKVDAASITGLLTASQIDAQDLKVAVANVTGLMEAGKIKSTFLEVSQANISGKLSAAIIDVGSLVTKGLVIESDLEEGNVSIHGSCIDAGKIDAARIDTEGIIEQLGEDGMAELSFYDGSHRVGFVSAVEDNDTLTVWGAEDVLVTCATGDATVHANNDIVLDAATGSVEVISGDLWVDGTKIASSDRDVKNTMTYDLDAFAGLYRTLKPCRFKYNNGKSGRFHTGFIAQEVEQAIADAGFADTDLAVVVQKNHGTEDAGKYGVRYEEIIALNTAMVQKLMDRIDALESEIKQLKGE